MRSIKSDFYEKNNEADILIKHINDISNIEGNINITPILKSAFMLLLYNMIESTVALILQKVHETASRNTYNELSCKLKKIFISYYLTNENEKKQIECLDKIILNNLMFPMFNDFENKTKVFSGNLDARQINIVIGKYGIGRISTKNKDKLLIVKNKRNKIAHGEDMFKESCRNFTTEDLLKIKEATISFLQQLVEQTEMYIIQGRFKSR